MAAGASMSSGKEDYSTLTEDDIVGASLQPPFEKYTNVELRWWLQCRGVTVSTSMKKANIIENIHGTIAAKLPVIDVDGVHLYHKLQDSSVDSSSLPLPSIPLSGWESISLNNLGEMSTKIPCVTSGLLYTYLASGCGRKLSHGAFRALNRGFIHWQSGRLDHLDVHCMHPHFCHVRCKMTPSMKSGIYHVYMLLGKKRGLATIEKATCECAAGESASCTHISALLHALVAMRPATLSETPVAVPSTDGNSDEDGIEDLPVTSFSCQWKPPRKRKESTLKFADANFEKYVYGRERQHHWKPVKDFDPRPIEHRGKVPQLMQDLLKSVKGKGLGVSVLLDKDLQFTPSETSSATPEQPSIESKQEIIKKVASFKESLHVTPDKVREIERNTRQQALSPMWYSARRFRLTASVFGRVLHMLPSTLPDSLVKSLLYPRQISSPAIEWGKKNESTALNEYTKRYKIQGNIDVIVCTAGFVVCEEHPFLGASPDAYVHDPLSSDQYGLVEIKCPYIYRSISPVDAARASNFCSKVVTSQDGRSSLELKQTHTYYCQVQGQMAITKRKWCDFVIYTTKGISVERIHFDEYFWNNILLPKLTNFYNNCLCPSIVSPIYLLGMKVHDLRV